MSRIIHTQKPGKIRNQHRRTIAEVLRRLSQKPQLDGEVNDMAALIVFSLHDIADTVEQTIDAWERRDYYMKAERFHQEWRWLNRITDELSAVISRDHNDSNVLCLSGDQIGDVMLRKIVEVWLNTEFSGGRHERRVRKIEAIEEGKDPRTISSG